MKDKKLVEITPEQLERVVGGGRRGYTRIQGSHNNYSKARNKQL